MSIQGPRDGDKFLDPHPADDTPLDYGEGGNSSDSEWEKLDLFDELVGDDEEDDEDGEYLDDDAI